MWYGFSRASADEAVPTTERRGKQRGIKPKEMKTNTPILRLLLIASSLMPAVAQATSADTREIKRPKIALVLSGGGALGLAHIGVLNELEQLHVPVDCIVGTSMGALIGGIYATGLNSQQIEQIISENDLASFFNDQPPRSEIPQKLKRDDYQPLFNFTFGYNDNGIQLPSGVSAGYKFELFLKQIVGLGAATSNVHFDDLPTPYRATATNLENGELKVFEGGDITKVMRTSMSLPAIIAPVELNGATYIDGGFVRNLPVEIGRALCGDILIAVNLGSRPKEISQIKTSLDVAKQSYVILSEQNVQTSLKKLSATDILISPDLHEFDSANFSQHQEIIQRGKAATQAQKEALSKLALTADDYQRWLNTRLGKIPATPTIVSIKARTTGKVNAEAIMRDVTTQAGKDFSAKQLTHNIVDIYGRGDFSYVGYTIIPDDENADIVIDAISKPWGPGYLKFGIGVATDFNSPTQFNLASSYRQTWVNSLGAEWRVDTQIGYDSFINTEFIQPLQTRDGIFISPYGGLRRHSIQFYNQKLRIGEYKVKRLDAGLDFGLTNKLGELKFGPYYSDITATPDFGLVNSLIPEEAATQSGLLLKAVYDQLDSPDFPRSGIKATTRIMAAKNKWGSDDEYTLAQASLTGAISLGKHSILGHLEWGDEISGVNDLPIYDAFKLGGPNRLSGLYLDQLTGTRYNLATLNYYYQYAKMASQLGKGMYLGLSLETGRIDDPFLENSWEIITSGSVFWGADTVLGTIYLGYGYSSLKQNSVYLVVSGSHF